MATSANSSQYRVGRYYFGQFDYRGYDSLTSIDASAAIGVVSVTTGNLDIGSTDVVITGGSGLTLLMQVHTQD